MRVTLDWPDELAMEVKDEEDEEGIEEELEEYDEELHKEEELGEDEP